MNTRNVGWRDAGIRGFMGLALLMISTTFQDRPLVALGIGFLALILLGTALSRSCPLYRLLGIDGHPRPPHPSGT